MYDPQADAWTELAGMGTRSARHGHASAAVGGKLYVFGGHGADVRSILSTVEIYDPASNSWAQGLSLTSAPRESAAAVAL